MGFLAGKRLLVTGVLSNRSIAYGIARALRREGAELAFSYQGERFKERVAEFAAEFGSTLVFDCDVADDAQIEAMFAALGEAWPTFHGFVHSIGFAPKEAIAGDFLEGLSREAFRIAHDISSYSFPAMAKAAAGRPRARLGASHPDLSGGAAQRSQLQHDGSGQGVARGERALPGDQPRPEGRSGSTAISAGPIKTLAASGIKGFGKILDVVAQNAPLRRNVTIDDVGNVAAFLLSDLAAGVTSEIVYVDGGFSHAMPGAAWAQRGPPLPPREGSAAGEGAALSPRSGYAATQST